MLSLGRRHDFHQPFQLDGRADSSCTCGGAYRTRRAARRWHRSLWLHGEGTTSLHQHRNLVKGTPSRGRRRGVPQRTLGLRPHAWPLKAMTSSNGEQVYGFPIPQETILRRNSSPRHQDHEDSKREIDDPIIALCKALPDQPAPRIPL